MTLGFVAHAAFWVLLVIAATTMRLRNVAVFVGLWTIGYLGSRGFRGGDFVFQSYVALLDIVLVLMVFKRDIRLS